MATFKSVWRRGRFWSGIGLLVLLLIVLATWQRIFIFIGPGHEGVLWSRFGGGTVMDRAYSEGFHITWPWNRMYIYDVRLQEIHGSTAVLTNDGLELGVKWSARFYPRRDSGLAKLHKEIGPDYVERVVRPEVISALRRVLGNYTPEQIYAMDEQGLLQELATTVKEQVTAKPISFDVLLLQELKLPKLVSDAINAKLEQEHIALAYVFRLQREEQERKRKQIEAEGIQAFERISGISILKWRGIEATLELAKSPNTKIIVVGTGSQGLPIILGADR